MIIALRPMIQIQIRDVKQDELLADMQMRSL